jgi:hypothetical protein
MLAVAVAVLMTIQSLVLAEPAVAVQLVRKVQNLRDQMELQILAEVAVVLLMVLAQAHQSYGKLAVLVDLE